jgi:hypothetical protein
MCKNIEGAKYRVIRARTVEEAEAAVAEAKELRDHFVFIEMVVSPRDAAPGERGCLTLVLGVLPAPDSALPAL